MASPKLNQVPSSKAIAALLLVKGRQSKKITAHSFLD